MRNIYLYAVLLLLTLAGCHKDRIDVIQTTPVTTAFTVSSLFQDNMVVQRDKPLAIWGQVPHGTAISVSVSWESGTVSTTGDANGNWTVVIPASAANSSPQTITVKAGSTVITLNNILVGDVWVCSGQSNMVMPMDSIPPFDGVTDYQQEVAAANYPLIRTLTITEDAEIAPVTNLAHPVTWNVCSPATAGATSAVAYYFAQKLQTTLNVPIGIIVSAVNGSYCQDWTNVEAIQGNSVLSGPYLAGSSTFYNGMINPLTQMTIKGFTWYQGEQNEADNPVANYTLLNAALISGWRSKFADASLPFYYVQITPFLVDYGSTKPSGSDTTADDLAFFREAQSNIRPITTLTGMVVTMDVGDDANHHPPDKKPVGQRLAYLALNKTYGQDVQCVGPQLSSWSATGNTATITFAAGTANGIGTNSNALLKQFFFVAGADKIFHQGSAVITGSGIVVTAPAGTPLPIVAVRYAFTDGAITNLQNSAGLPAEPFRTDNWTN